jgi:hypothetical protein
MAKGNEARRIGVSQYQSTVAKVMDTLFYGILTGYPELNERFKNIKPIDVVSLGADAVTLGSRVSLVLNHIQNN